MDESCIHTPIINVWNKQMERIRIFIKQNLNLEAEDVNRKFQILQKEMLDEIKGLLYVNYKDRISEFALDDNPKMTRLMSENKLLLSQLKEISKEVIQKSEKLNEKNSVIENYQKEIRRLELEQTVNKIQENMDKDQTQGHISKLENQIALLNQKLCIIKDAVNNNTH
ncbi:hypothetical protein FG386_002430 [Cryptosporidium ryanae]|uniref:uncharacterized protein n=1 Tax=Cryptosporidium ryanae TaxID=515981 RepID=UPI00351A9D70|nr:hypothetical protein FG386_002430 [Cryptosporidium ryanae]